MPKRHEMISRPPVHILPLLLLPVLIGCGPSAPPPPAPLSNDALAAVVEHPGVVRESLARAIDELFTDEAAGETRGLMVLHNGKIAAERYGPGYDRHTRFLGWSMSKCVTGVMIGQLVADGRLKLDESPPIPAWQRPGDPRGAITLRHLLQMRSGLKHSETAAPLYEADTVRMLYLDGRDDMAAYAEAQPLVAAPGAGMTYSTATSVILADLAARVLSPSTDPELRRKAVSTYLRTRLFEPLALRSMVGEYDAAGTLVGGSLFSATARDWGRFGEFFRNGGTVKGAQIVPRGWISFMTSPSPANPGYGAQLWLNHPQPSGKRVLMPGQAPADLFACIGHRGQYVLVSPSQHLTVVRLGLSEEERKAVLDRLAAVLRVFPKE